MTWRSVNTEHFKSFESFLKCSHKNHQALWWNWLSMRTATGMEDPESPLLQRISSLELPASEIAALINASLSSSNRHLSTSIVQRRLRESGDHGQNHGTKSLLNDINKKKRLAWAKKHKQWTLDQWKSVLWSDESEFDIFGFNHRVFVICRVGEQMISAYVVPTKKLGEGGVMVVCWWHCQWFI